MNRRDALKYSTLMFGYAATGTAISAIASGCKVEPKTNWVPEFMTEDQAISMSSIIDMILPKTETPSGSEVGVAEFFDYMLMNFAGEKEKTTFKGGMELINANAQKSHSKMFNDLSDEQKLDMITELDKRAFAEVKEGELPRMNDVDELLWKNIKSNAYFAYFTSEKIGKEVLTYLPNPGPYEGCVDLSVSNGKLWTV